MAADWLKVELVLPEKPEVLALSAALEISRDEVVGKLIRFWRWVDQQLETGQACRMELQFVDALIGLDGFAAALVDVGWLAEIDGGVEIPKWERHLSQGSKRRALEMERQRRLRQGRSAPPPKAKKKRAKKAAAPAAVVEEPSEFSFILEDGSTWVMSKAVLEGLGPLYPGVNIPVELRKCSSWVEREVDRRKSGSRGMLRCIHSWLDKSAKQARTPARPLNFDTD